jgi:hypothetical protein
MTKNPLSFDFTEDDLRSYGLTWEDVHRHGFTDDDLRKPIDYSLELGRFINVADIIKLGFTNDDLRRPVCYDPSRRKFIFIAEVLAGREKLIPTDSLDESDLKKLVVLRFWTARATSKAGPMKGPFLSTDEIALEILEDKPFGRTTLEADRSHLPTVHKLIVAAKQKLDKGMKK